MNSGDTIGKYRLVSRLGRGGMGEVWLAKASGYGGFTKTVVLKTLLPELASDPLFVDLLAREAKTCSALSHPNLIEVFDFTRHDGVYLLAMEHVLGQPLSAILRSAHARGWALPAWFALRVAWDCCCGLQAAHDQGVVHCDLSPSNVMVTYTGATKVLDFGVAHTVALGPKSDRLKGKYSYMAPERIKTRATDRRTDIYALGVMLYLVFTGQLPFVGETDAELLHKITHEKLVTPSAHVELDVRIERLILRAMAPDPKQRFQTISEVLEALAPCLDGQLGTYGQQHVAAFVNTLFGAESNAPIPRVLPPVPPIARADGTLGPRADSLEDLEIDLDSGPCAVPPTVHDASTARVRPASPHVVRRPLGSVQIPPLPAPKQPRPAKQQVPGPIAAFAQASTPHEPKTSVQSLFGERPASASTIAGLFARGTRDDVSDDAKAVVSDEAKAVVPDGVWPWAVSRTKTD